MLRIITVILIYLFVLGEATAQRSLDVLYYGAKKNMEKEWFMDGYKQFIKVHKLDDDSLNVHRYAQIVTLHRLFTSTYSHDGSSLLGDAPYMWNDWVNDTYNKRITIKRNDTLLIRIPSHTGKYKNFAYEERTPDIFLGDFFDGVDYSHHKYGRFSTFGWCSEREMAFSVLMFAYGFPAVVEAPGTHAWSIVSPQFHRNGELVDFTVKVDNTYNTIDWDYESIYEPNKLTRWYNKQVNKHMKAAYHILNEERAFEIINLIDNDQGDE